MNRFIAKTRLRLRLARLHFEAWALRHDWSGNWIDREDTLENVEAEKRQVRFQLRYPAARFRPTDGSDMTTSARNMIPEGEE